MASRCRSSNPVWAGDAVPPPATAVMPSVAEPPAGIVNVAADAAKRGVPAVWTKTAFRPSGVPVTANPRSALKTLKSVVPSRLASMSIRNWAGKLGCERSPNVGTALQFGVTTFGERSHPSFPAQFRMLIDANRDGTTDFSVFNADLGFAVTGTPDGRNAVFVQRAGTTTAQAFFFTDVDLNSANAILTVPLSAVGLTSSTQFDLTALAIDNYFTGAVTDAIGPMTFTAGTPRFAASAATLTIPAGGSATLGITAVAGGGTASPAQTGLLLLQRDAIPGEESDQILVS